jgi:hypothetical protein
MGYYIETPVLRDKAEWLRNNYNAALCQAPQSFDQIPADVALVVTVDNGMFEAAGYVYSEREIDSIVNAPAAGDTRPRKFLLMDKDTVELLSGYHRTGGMPNYTVMKPTDVKEAVAQARRNGTPIQMPGVDGSPKA